MSVPPYKAEYDPLYKAMRKLKKTSQIKSLSMGPPMGAIPAGVDVELAKEFTGTFCAALIVHIFFKNSQHTSHLHSNHRPSSREEIWRKKFR